MFLSFRNILQPSAKNCDFGNESSILVSVNKQISVSLRTRFLKPENLFLTELILRCPIITLGLFRRCSCRPFNVSQGVSEETVSTDFANSIFCLVE